MMRRYSAQRFAPLIWIFTILGMFSYCASQVVRSPRPVAILASIESQTPRARESSASTGDLSPQPIGASTLPPQVARGQALFAGHCVICHGETGNGLGKFAYLMNPRPRNLKLGKFKLTTTQNLIPSDEDLLRTIVRGMPGSAMPPWGHLPAADLNALVAYVRHVHVQAVEAELAAGVADGSVAAEEVAGLLAQRTQPGPPIVVPPEPAFDDLRWFNGRRVYLEACASCHGADGRPLPEAVKFDDEGYPTPPRSFVDGIFKGSMEGPDLYCRILKGMRGTPMPASEGNFTSDEIWDLIHYVQSLAREGSQGRAQLRQNTITAAARRTSASGSDSSSNDAR